MLVKVAKEDKAKKSTKLVEKVANTIKNLKKVVSELQKSIIMENYL